MLDSGTISTAIREAFADNLAGQKSLIVQSLVFSKKKFNRASARSWAKSHGFKNSKVDITKNSVRLRQLSPGRCVSGSFRTKSLTTGVSAVMCKRK